MTADQYWNAVVKKYPQFAEEGAKINMTSDGIKRLVYQAYDKGDRRGQQKGLLSAGAVDMGLHPEDPFVIEVVEELLMKVGL